MQIKLNRLICLSILLLFIVMTAGIGSADEVNIELMSYFYGGTGLTDVAVSGNYAYLVNDNGLYTVDISNPSSPIITGTYGSDYYNSGTSGIAVSGNYAYLSVVAGGLEIIDVSDPSFPKLVGGYYNTSSTWNVAVSGNYAYLISDAGLYIVDISNPSSPKYVGNYDTPSQASEVAISGNYAYIAADNLIILDISDPSYPKYIGSCDATGWVTDVAISGNYAYITETFYLNGYHGSTDIVDISNPAAPKIVGSYSTGNVNYSADDVKVLDNYAYIIESNGFENYLLIVDITNPSAPELAGKYQSFAAYRVVVSGNYAYLTSVHGGFSIIHMETVKDTTPPASVTNLNASYVGVDWIGWTWERPDNEFCVADIYIDGKFVESLEGFYYVASGLSEGTTHTISIQTKDYDGNINSTFVNDSATTLTADKATVKLVGSYDTTDRAEGIAISGKYAYIISNPYGTGDYNAYLEIVDISDPSSPKITGSCVPGFSINSPVYADDIDIYGTYAYISSYSHLFIVDISNPSAPKVVNVINPYYGIQDVAISGNYAYIASDAGLLIWDLTNPVIPRQVSSYDTAGSVNKVAVEGNYAYVSGYGFSIVDITNPSSPKLVAYVDEWVDDFAISGNYAYLFYVGFVGAGPPDFFTTAIDVVDISNPSAPKLVNDFSYNGCMVDVVVSGNSAYIADYGDLFIMDISNPLDSTLLGSPIPYYLGGTTGVEVSGEYVYVVGSNGFSILSIDTAPVTTPTTVSYAPLYDNRLRESSPTSVFSTINYLDIGKLGTANFRDVMLFDLSSYKTTDTISKATLSLYWYYPAGATRTSDTIVEIYRPLDWDPKYVTWNSRLSGTLWTTAGGNWFDKNGVSQGATPYASLTFAGSKVPDNKYYEFDVTQLVQEYVSGKYKNTGFFLKAKTESGNYIAFYSSEWSNAAVRPKLTVTSTSGSTPTDSAPVANAGADKTATVGSAVVFDGSASTDDKPIASYSWDFDASNGITSEASTVSTTKTYTTAGTYTVTLTVTDTIGQKSTDTLQVVVSAVTPPASTVSYVPTYDNRLRESSATTVLSTTGYIDVGRTTASFRDVMLFDLSSYKTTDTISKATLSLYWYYPAGATRTSDTIVEIYRPLDWDPKYVTWNSRLSGTLWTTAGGNWFDKNGIAQGTTPYASLTFAGSKVPDNKYYDFDVTQLVQEYVSGKYKNTGFFLKAKTESGNYIAFYSSEWTNAAQRPKLTVTSASGSTTIDNQPVANAGADKTATVGSAVTFDASASTDDKGITSYSWDFDASNGITSEASTVSATKTYTAVGTYTVTLTVTDTIGQKSTDTLQVVVSAVTTPTSTVSYAPVYDNRLREASATTVLSTTNYIDVGSTTANFRDVMLFDLSSYKTTDTISKATLSLYWYYPAGKTRTSDTIVEIYRPLDWDPQYVTWNSRLSGTLWSTAGGNWFDKNNVAQGTTPYASLTFTGSKVPDNKYYEFDVTQLVQEYVSGKYKNTGFFLKAKTESGNYIAFYSNDWSNAAQRPKLSITSTTGSTITDSAPVANAGADKTSTTNSAVTFDGSASTDDKGITSYSWDFDASNGITSEATGVMTAKAYTTAGTYTVTLTVTDTAGQKSTDTLQVTVSNLVSSVSYVPLYDNRLRSETPTSVLSTTNYLDIGRSSVSARDVMIFDLTSYKTTDAISKATLSLYWYFPAGKTRTSDTVVEVYRPVEWDPRYVTWNSRLSGTLWSTAGGNWFDKNNVAQGTTPYASLTFTGTKIPDNKYYDFDVTQLVQEYISGKYKNTGFFLKAKTESSNYIAFYSSEWTNAAQRPKLTITR